MKTEDALKLCPRQSCCHACTELGTIYVGENGILGIEWVCARHWCDWRTHQMAGKKIELLCDECLAIAKDRSSAFILEKQMCGVRGEDPPGGPESAGAVREREFILAGAWCAGRSCDAFCCVVAMKHASPNVLSTQREVTNGTQLSPYPVWCTDLPSRNAANDEIHSISNYDAARNSGWR